MPNQTYFLSTVATEDGAASLQPHNRVTRPRAAADSSVGVLLMQRFRSLCGHEKCKVKNEPNSLLRNRRAKRPEQCERKRHGRPPGVSPGPGHAAPLTPRRSKSNRRHLVFRFTKVYCLRDNVFEMMSLSHHSSH